jgi:choline dehydrogenase-like flavoprotein
LAKTAYGTAYWLDRFPASRRPSYPRYRGDLRTDVVVVGGGALGCSIAYAFSAAGIDVVLLEQGRLAQHQAGHGSGIVVHEPEPDFHVLAAVPPAISIRRPAAVRSNTWPRCAGWGSNVVCN